MRGVTYGTFAPDEDGVCLGSPEQVRRDFAAMTEHGFNVVRTYTAPPVWLLDEAHRNDVYVMAGLAWEQQFATRACARQSQPKASCSIRSAGIAEAAQTTLPKRGRPALHPLRPAPRSRTHPQPERRDE